MKENLVEELTDLLDAENQLTKALPTMAKSATVAQVVLPVVVEPQPLGERFANVVAPAV